MNRRTIIYTAIAITLTAICSVMFISKMLSVIDLQAEEIRHTKSTIHILSYLGIMIAYSIILSPPFVVAIVMLIRRYCRAPQRKQQPAPRNNPSAAPNNLPVSDTPRRLILSTLIAIVAGTLAYVIGTLCNSGLLPENLRPPIAIVVAVTFISSVCIFWCKPQERNP